MTLVGCGALTTVQALRDPQLGIDVGSYLNAFHLSHSLDFLAGDTLYNFEIGFSLYAQFLAKQGLSDQWFLAITAIVTMLPVGLTIRRYSRMPALSVFLYATLGFYLFSYSGLRQAMAVAICFWAYRFIIDRKPLPFLAMVLAASLFHQSALAFIPAYWLFPILPTGPIVIAGIAIIIATFALRAEIYPILYSLYRDSPVLIENTGAGLLFVALALLWLAALALGGPDDKGHNSPTLNGTRNYLYLAVLFQALASVSFIVGRTGYYYLIFLVLLVPELIERQEKPSIKAAMWLITVPACLLFFFTQAGAFGLNPYKSFN
ncbi:EpsG family protein [Nocardioides sp. cx-169]|uniref:EpsG family protein n=1 Tax=Nocardioides sp. cx-169 TaxID=2899080 RepID=UPI001E5A0467|nr:EpsG family protein [Nocardioides sp. cx-169]MCD4533749.1 EpsG family protein [Nocardioides sp. cx-169]